MHKKVIKNAHVNENVGGVVLNNSSILCSTRNIRVRNHFFCRVVIGALGIIYPFYEPVNHVALGLNDYTNIVKNPMDLSTIKRRLEADYYEEYQSVYSDVKLMFENCCLYNPPGHDVVKMAKKAEILAEKR